MKQTRLYDRHVELGGRMVPFADYELPVQYTAGPNAEHRSVRTAAGVFDIDHMGQFALSGEDALSFLQYVQVADVSSVKEWEARYSLLCYEDGTIVDDIFIYRLPEKMADRRQRGQPGERISPGCRASPTVIASN